MTSATPSYKGHRYPVEIINHCVWLYFRFPLSFGEVEEQMLVRGRGESRDDPAEVRQVRARLRRSAVPAAPAAPATSVHLEEVLVGINGRRRYLWRAVDPHGNELDVLFQSCQCDGAFSCSASTLSVGIASCELS